MHEHGLEFGLEPQEPLPTPGRDLPPVPVTEPPGPDVPPVGEPPPRPEDDGPRRKIAVGRLFIRRIARLPMAEVLLARVLVTRHSRLPRELRTVSAAIAMIDDDVPREVVEQEHWVSARDCLHAARESENARDVEKATGLLETALQREGWLH